MRSIKIYINIWTLFTKREHFIQSVLIATTLVSLTIEPPPHDLSSNNFWYKNLENPFKIEPLYFKDSFKNSKSPARATLIICNDKSTKCLESLNRSLINHKLNFSDIIFTAIRSIFQSKCFALVYLTFATGNRTKLHPLGNHQPNSE